MVVSRLDSHEAVEDTAPEPASPLVSPIRVCLVEDDRLLRKSLRLLLELQRDICVVAEASTATEAILVLTTVKPDVLVLDVRLPDGNGLDLLAAFGTTDGCPPTIILTADPTVNRAQAFRSGARGFVNKADETSRLADAVRLVAHGGRF